MGTFSDPTGSRQISSGYLSLNSLGFFWDRFLYYISLGHSLLPQPTVVVNILQLYKSLTTPGISIDNYKLLAFLGMELHCWLKV